MLKRKIINNIAIVALTILLTLTFFSILSWWWVVLTVFIWLLITLSGSFFIQWNYHFTSFHSNPNNTRNQIAITFDDGPNPVYTPVVLDLLAKHKAKATFFCIGKQIEKHPEIVQRILSEGHVIGNHTYSHSKSFGFLKTEKVKTELHKTNRIVTQLFNKKMILYRPAFGVTNPKIQKAVQQLNLHSIGWNVRSLDTTSRTESQVLQRITSKIAKGDIVLLHDTSAKSVTVLEQLLLFLHEKSLKSVTVDHLLEIEAYA